MPAMTDDTPSVTRFGQADLQIHTAHGDGMADARALLDHVEQYTDLDVLAVTDHDDVEGALRAQELHAQGNYRFEFVPGIELTTRSGHLLALWIDEPLPSLRPLEESVAAVHRAGGLAVVPHPFSWLTRSIGQRALERVLASEDPAVHPDGIEVANPTLAGRVTGAKASRLNAERYGLAETGGSDAHFLEHVGSATTQFEGTTAADLRRAIEQRRCSGVTHGAPGLRTLGVRRLAEQQVRGLAVTPRKVVGERWRRLREVARR
ncbi:MAG: phosphotransferase [Chloroflexi bacterium]|nr:phosphotransferase [Chloroflexota bacterium]